MFESISRNAMALHWALTMLGPVYSGYNTSNSHQRYFYSHRTAAQCQRILSQLETAAQCLTYSMCQFEAPGGSSLLKLLVTDLWTLLWTILLMHLTRLSSPLLSKKICSVLNVKSRLSRQHILSQLETTVQYSTHTMYRHLCQDEVQL